MYTVGDKHRKVKRRRCEKVKKRADRTGNRGGEQGLQNVIENPLRRFVVRRAFPAYRGRISLSLSFCLFLSALCIPQNLGRENLSRIYPTYTDERARSIVNGRLMEWNSHPDRRFHLSTFVPTSAMGLLFSSSLFLSVSLSFSFAQAVLPEKS